MTGHRSRSAHTPSPSIVEFDAFTAKHEAESKVRITEHLKAPTYQDEVRSELRKALADFRYFVGFDGKPINGKLTDGQQAALLGYLLPKVMELVDHACQLSRIERGVLPYDED